VSGIMRRTAALGGLGMASVAAAGARAQGSFCFWENVASHPWARGSACGRPIMRAL
jgi:hypothetical protein